MSLSFCGCAGAVILQRLDEVKRDVGDVKRDVGQLKEGQIEQAKRFQALTRMTIRPVQRPASALIRFFRPPLSPPRLSSYRTFPLCGPLP